MQIIVKGIKPHFAEKIIEKCIEITQIPPCTRDEIKIKPKMWKELTKNESRLRWRKYQTRYSDCKNNKEYQEAIYLENKYKNLKQNREFHNEHVNGNEGNFGLGFGLSSEGQEGCFI